MTVIGSPLGYRADAKRKFVPISILRSYLMSGCAMSKMASSTSKQQLERNVAFGGGDKYSIKIVNNSNRAWHFFVFQQPPPDAYEAKSLAWLASPYQINNGGDQITFTWSIQYEIMWAQTGKLLPGVIFSASGSREAHLTSNNSSSFTFTPPTLSKPIRGGAEGSLTIEDGPGVPPNDFSVGVGMGNKGVYAINAGPNLQHIFTPQPSYWVCAINQVTESEVMNIATITRKAEVEFKTNKFLMTATLQGDNTWKIE